MRLAAECHWALLAYELLPPGHELSRKIEEYGVIPHVR